MEETTIETIAGAQPPVHRPAITVSDAGIELAATAKLPQMSHLSAELDSLQWPAAVLFQQCSKMSAAQSPGWSDATIGGSLCLSASSDAMISLVAALEGMVLIRTLGGGEHSLSIFDFVTGDSQNVLQAGDQLRSVFLPAPVLASRTAFRQLATSDLGRSAAIVAGRSAGHTVVLTLTAACHRPYRVVVESSAGPATIAAAVDTVVDGDWAEDQHGAADWRRAISVVMAAEIVEELHPILPLDR